jgi:hypothetical protein
MFLVATELVVLIPVTIVTAGAESGSQCTKGAGTNTFKVLGAEALTKLLGPETTTGTVGCLCFKHSRRIQYRDFLAVLSCLCQVFVLHPVFCENLVAKLVILDNLQLFCQLFTTYQHVVIYTTHELNLRFNS